MRPLLFVYNKSRTIGQIIQEVSEFISEIVAINDHSRDRRGLDETECLFN